MRFKRHISHYGEKKTVTKFLWFPITIDYIDHYETRWLEKATIEYVYRIDFDGYGYWMPFRFLN